MRRRPLSSTVRTAWRPENDVVVKNFGKSVKVMGIKGGRSLFEGLAWGHCHSILLRILECGAEGSRQDDELR
jgi:hypothetical protein